MTENSEFETVEVESVDVAETEKPNLASQFLPEEDVLTGTDPVTPDLRSELWKKGYGVVRRTESGWRAVKRPS